MLLELSVWPGLLAYTDIKRMLQLTTCCGVLASLPVAATV